MAGIVVVLAVNGKLKMAVNPMTRQVTDRPQQFRATAHPDHSGFGLEILSLSEYVEDPKRMDVTEEHYR